MSPVDAPARLAFTGPYRDWLRTLTAVTSLLADGAPSHGVYASAVLPKTAALPAICVQVVGPAATSNHLDGRLVQHDIWAADAVDCDEIEAALRTALEQALPGTPLGDDGLRLMGADAPAGISLPDPDDGTNRHVVTATVTTRVGTAPEDP